MLVASMNPCPCGYLSDPKHTCVCTPQQVAQYRSRISGPLLDRIDLHVEVGSVPYRELREVSGGEQSEAIRERVEAARALQRARYGSDAHCNAHMTPTHIREFCRVDADAHALLERVVDHLGMSARAYARILKVARTIADLAGEAEVGAGTSPRQCSTGSWIGEMRDGGRRRACVAEPSGDDHGEGTTILQIDRARVDSAVRVGTSLPLWN